MDIVQVVKSLLEIGWPGIITAAFAYLAIQYISDQRAQITYLRSKVDTLESELIRVKQALLDSHLMEDKTKNGKQ